MNDIKSFSEETDSSGQIVSSQQYDAFGNPVSSTGTWSGPFAYGGRFGYQSDSDLSLLYHRYYDSTTGRFLSRDPIGDGRNWYAYCYNNPINLFDASGLEPAPAEVAPEALLPDGRRTEGGRMGPDPTWYIGAANFFAGWGDTLTVGGTYLLRELAGLNDVIDGSSGAYRAGIAVGVAHGVALGGLIRGAVRAAAKQGGGTVPLLGRFARIRVWVNKKTKMPGYQLEIGRKAVGRLEYGRLHRYNRSGWHFQFGSRPGSTQYPWDLRFVEPWVLPPSHPSDNEPSVARTAPLPHPLAQLR